MNDAADAATTGAAASAGRLMREARERQGLHIAALAASIKVAPKKLELLEADRFDALPDATFTRALAQTVCRALKIDPAPVLRLMPPPAGHRLDQVGEGLNAPFRERPGALVQRDGSSLTLGPAFWITALILIAALGVYFVPSGVLGVAHWRGAVAASTAAAASAIAAPTVVALTAPAASEAANATPSPGGSTSLSAVAQPSPSPSGDAAAPPGSAARLGEPVSMPLPTANAVVAAPPADAAAAGDVQLRTTSESWIEVTDARGRALVARLVLAGESVDVEGQAPFRVRIGNASATRLVFRGQPMELAGYTRDNVARLELK